MKMIIGGAFQGKLSYAKKSFPSVEFADGKEINRQNLFKVQGVNHFEEFLRNEITAGKDISDLAAELIKNNPDLILICNEVGYGIVPVDRTDRQVREAVGRICTDLASYSDTVIRVMCGIGKVIKE